MYIPACDGGGCILSVYVIKFVQHVPHHFWVLVGILEVIYIPDDCALWAIDLLVCDELVMRVNTGLPLLQICIMDCCIVSIYFCIDRRVISDMVELIDADDFSIPMKEDAPGWLWSWSWEGHSGGDRKVFGTWWTLSVVRLTTSL